MKKLALSGLGIIRRFSTFEHDTTPCETKVIGDESQKVEETFLTMLQEDYNRLGSVRIAAIEQEYGVIIISTNHLPDNEEPLIIQSDPADALNFTKVPEFLPPIKDYYGKSSKTPHEEPKGYAKKKRSKRRQQKQSRKRNNN